MLSKSIARVNIFLTDLNDNAPRFHKDKYRYVLNDVHATTLDPVNATDPDEGINSEFDFALHGVTRVSRRYGVDYRIGISRGTMGKCIIHGARIFRS